MIGSQFNVRTSFTDEFVNAKPASAAIYSPVSYSPPSPPSLSLSLSLSLSRDNRLPFEFNSISRSSDQSTGFRGWNGGLFVKSVRVDDWISRRLVTDRGRNPALLFVTTVRANADVGIPKRHRQLKVLLTLSKLFLVKNRILNTNY